MFVPDETNVTAQLTVGAGDAPGVARSSQCDPLAGDRCAYRGGRLIENPGGSVVASSPLICLLLARHRSSPCGHRDGPRCFGFRPAE